MSEPQWNYWVEEDGNKILIHLPGYFEKDFVYAKKDDILDRITAGKEVILDMEDTQYMDSSGLGFLVTCRKRAEANGATLTLKDVQERPMRLFKTVRILDGFQIITSPTT